MTKPDFAELKEKLTTFDDNKSQGSMPMLYEHIDRVDLWITAQKKQYSQSSVIITELLEIISLQNKEVESYARYICCAETCKLSTSWSDNAKCTCGAEKLKNSVKQALSETNTRLQKLREKSNV